MLVEPGALDRDVPSQVDFALATLDDLIGLLGWRAAADDLNAVVRAALPATANDARLLRGGLGLGVAADPDLELRVYLDLRAGVPAARWQRLADTLSLFGDAETEATLRGILRRGAPVAMPVALAAVLADGALRGLRLYLGVEYAGYAQLAALTALPAETIARFCERLGPFGPQRVTAAFDFALVDGSLRGILARTKLDACRLGIPPREVRAELEALADVCRLERAPLHAFLDDLRDAFDGSTIQYVGVGHRGDETEVTVYAQPAGLARR